MNKSTAIVITLIFAILFFFVAFNLATLKPFSALALTALGVFIIINASYQWSQAIFDVYDFSLFVYVAIQFISIAIIIIYIIFKTIQDTQSQNTKSCLNNF